MFLNVCKQMLHIYDVHLSKCKKCSDVKSWAYYFHVLKVNIADFQIGISLP